MWTGSVKGSRISFIALFPSRQFRTASLVPLSDRTNIGLTLHSGFSPPEQAVTKDDGLRRRNHSPTWKRALSRANAQDDDGFRASRSHLDQLRRRNWISLSPRLHVVQYHVLRSHGTFPWASRPFFDCCSAKASTRSIQSMERILMKRCLSVNSQLCCKTYPVSLFFFILGMTVASNPLLFSEMNFEHVSSLTAMAIIERPRHLTTRGETAQGHESACLVCVLLATASWVLLTIIFFLPHSQLF